MFKIITDQDGSDIIKYIIQKNIGEIVDDSFYHCLELLTRLDIDRIREYLENNISILTINKNILDKFCQEYDIGLKIIDIDSNIYYKFDGRINYVILNFENYESLFYSRSYEVCSQLNSTPLINIPIGYHEKTVSFNKYDSKKYERKIFGKQKLLHGLLTTRDVLQNMIKINFITSNSNQVKNIDKIKNTNLNTFFNDNIDILVGKEEEIYQMIISVESEINELKLKI